MTSYGLLTIEQNSVGYGIYLNGKLYKGSYSDLNACIRDFESMPN